MPIRAEAALKVAEALLGTYVEAGMCNRSSVESAADIICNAVAIDEMQVQLAKLRGEAAQS